MDFCGVADPSQAIVFGAEKLRFQYVWVVGFGHGYFGSSFTCRMFAGERRLKHDHFVIWCRVLIGGVLQDVFHLLPGFSSIVRASVIDLDVTIVEFEHTTRWAVALVFRNDQLSLASDDLNPRNVAHSRFYRLVAWVDAPMCWVWGSCAVSWFLLSRQSRSE